MRRQLSKSEKSERRLKKLESVWETVSKELSLNENDSIKKNVHKLVEEASNVQKDICNYSDSIKYDNFDKANEIVPVDKPTYLAFVDLTAKKMNDKVTEKTLDKFTEDFEKKVFNVNFRNSFMNSYLEGDNLKIADADDVKIEDIKTHKCEEFEQLMEDSAKKRLYINEVLRPKYKSLAEAAEYITSGDLTFPKFKQIVDFEHYDEGGYPHPNSPAKLWDIYRKFNEAYRLMNDYEFSQIGSLNKEFGLGIQLGKENPEIHPWMENE